jgi:pantothenate kinase type III
MQAGISYGYVSLVDGIVKKMKEETYGSVCYRYRRLSRILYTKGLKRSMR